MWGQNVNCLFFLDENILRTTQVGSLSLLVVVVLLARNITYIIRFNGFYDEYQQPAADEGS